MVRVVRPESVVRDSIPSAAHASAFRTIEFARRSTVINMPDDGRAPCRGDRLPITFARECARNAVALKQPAHLLVTGAVQTAVDASRRRGAEALVPEVPGPVVEQDIVSPELSALKRQTAPDHIGETTRTDADSARAAGTRPLRQEAGFRSRGVAWWGRRQFPRARSGPFSATRGRPPSAAQCSTKSIRSRRFP